MAYYAGHLLHSQLLLSPTSPAALQIKQNVILKYKYLVTFLRQNSKDIFAEVGGPLPSGNAEVGSCLQGAQQRLAARESCKGSPFIEL